MELTNASMQRETGDLFVLEIMLLNVGSAALIAGDLDESKPLLAESLRIAHQIDDRLTQFYLLDAFGCHAALSGQARLATQLLGAADTVGTQAGANVMPFLAPLLAQAQESASSTWSVARHKLHMASTKLWRPSPYHLGHDGRRKPLQQITG